MPHRETLDEIDPDVRSLALVRSEVLQDSLDSCVDDAYYVVRHRLLPAKITIAPMSSRRY